MAKAAQSTASSEKATEKATTAKTAPTTPLKSIADHAEDFRLPGWQMAALKRSMGWEDGKEVSADDFQTALDRLKSRRMGG